MIQLHTLNPCFCDHSVPGPKYARGEQDVFLVLGYVQAGRINTQLAAWSSKCPGRELFQALGDLREGAGLC